MSLAFTSAWPGGASCDHADWAMKPSQGHKNIQFVPKSVEHAGFAIVPLTHHIKITKTIANSCHCPPGVMLLKNQLNEPHKNFVCQKTWSKFFLQEICGYFVVVSIFEIQTFQRVFFEPHIRHPQSLSDCRKVWKAFVNKWGDVGRVAITCELPFRLQL